MRLMRGEEAFFFLLAAVIFFFLVAEEVLVEEDDEDCAKALSSNGEKSPLLTARVKAKTRNHR
jgi:hypothetical protein